MMLSTSLVSRFAAVGKSKFAASARAISPSGLVARSMAGTAESQTSAVRPAFLNYAFLLIFV